MQRPHERLNLIRGLTRLGRRTVEIICLDSDEITSGELVDTEVVSTVQEGGVENRQITHKRFLPCGHLAKASSITAICDVCGSIVCESEGCYAICRHCHRCLCRHCYRTYSDEDGEVTLCTSCHMDAKARRAAVNASRAIYHFFVKK